MTTDEAKAEISRILEEHCPGTYANGREMIAFLRAEADRLNGELQDAMSGREE